MSAKTSISAWGATATAPTVSPVKLHDVMDEELAAKLQREEEEEWEREIEAQFGDRGNVGWCFVEVPSSDSEFGVMSVIQQEVKIEEQDGGIDPNDPDYAFALELQAQEAEEYDRLRRQEASSMERIQVMQQDPAKRRQLRHFLPNGPTVRSRRQVSRYHTTASSAEFAVHLEEEYVLDSDEDEGEHRLEEFRVSEHRNSLLGTSTTARDEDDEEEIFLEDDLPIKKFNAIEITKRGVDRKHRTSSSSSTHRRS